MRDVIAKIRILDMPEFQTFAEKVNKRLHDLERERDDWEERYYLLLDSVGGTAPGPLNTSPQGEGARNAPDGQGSGLDHPVPEPSTMYAALKAIIGPADSGPFIAAYRAAGGGYEGLQAIARAAVGEL